MLNSFPALIRDDSRVLVLGSMPGAASLHAGQYYAHPRNAFWPIMAASFGFSVQADYAVRCAALLAHGVAIWDVLAQCERHGSLDAGIAIRSERANDIGTLLAAHPSIVAILLNGQKAASSLRRHHSRLHIATHTLPSTSPAHAARSLREKHALWHHALQRYGLSVTANVIGGSG